MGTQPARKGGPVPDDDDDVLNIDADDLTEEPLPPVLPDTAPTLDLSLDDLSDEPPDANAFPAVTPDQLLADKKSITIRTLCTSTGQPFRVRYVEDQPGLFVTHEVTTGEAAVATEAGGAGAVGDVQGSFGTSKDYACPYCGSQAIVVCGKCGTDLCAGTGGGKGHTITCPNCKARIGSIGGAATSATGLLGGGKGKGKR